MPSGDPRADTLLEHRFDVFTLHVLRAAVLTHAIAAGLSESRAVDVMLAVHELAANAVRHGAGSGQLRMEIVRGALHCQVSDTGPGDRNGQTTPGTAASTPGTAASTPGTAASTADPWPYEPGHGLWLARNAADQITVVTDQEGSVVTVVFTLPGKG